MSDGVTLLLSGGVGGAKLALGMARTMQSEKLVILANTGDDFDHLGLRICPDIDTLTYTLSGLSDPVRGWGREGETWNFMRALGALGGEDWFNLGDADLALHVLRTHLMRQGASLSDVTREVCERLGILARVLPMSDDPIATCVETEQGRMDFQTYFVREQCAPKVTGFVFEGQARARLNPAVQDLFTQGEVNAVVVAPSNPYVSIDPILGVPGFREILRGFEGPVIAVSPIVGGQAIKGPTAKMMAELGVPCDVTSIAERYRDFLDGILIDQLDADLLPRVGEMGLACRATQTVMTSVEDKEAVARVCQDFMQDLSGTPS